MLKNTEVQSSKITILLKSFLQGGCYFFWCTFARVSITDFACPKKMMCHDWVSLFCQHAMTEGDKILTPARCPMSRFLSIWVLANTGKFIKHVTCRQKKYIKNDFLVIIGKELYSHSGGFDCLVPESIAILRQSHYHHHRHHCVDQVKKDFLHLWRCHWSPTSRHPKVGRSLISCSYIIPRQFHNINTALSSS